MMANIFFKSPISYVFRRINHLLNDLLMAIFGKIRSKMKENWLLMLRLGFKILLVSSHSPFEPESISLIIKMESIYIHL